MLIRFWLPLIFLAALAPLRAQDEPIHMRPEFALVFPLIQNGDDVSVKYPVMINPATIIKPGMVLRVLYVLSDDAQGASGDLVLAHKGNMEQSYSRDPAGAGNKLPPELAHELDGYRRTDWQVSNNFVLAMAQMPTDTMHLIYSPTGGDKDKDLNDERFSFFDGLFVGQPNGKVTVLAVEKDSKAEHAGLKAGDVIASVGGTSVEDNLASFAANYAAAKKAATENEIPSYSIIVHPGGGAETREVNIAMPPSLKGGLMDGFDSELKPTPQPAPAKPAAP